MSVYAVELCAVLLALEWVEEVEASKILICSDSVSALSSIKSGSARNHQDLVYEILFTNSRLARQGGNIVFMWVPAHSGVPGLLDKLAKEAVRRENVEINIKLSKKEGKSIVWREIIKQWQQYWNSAPKGRHLHKVQSKIGGVRNPTEKNK